MNSQLITSTTTTTTTTTTIISPRERCSWCIVAVPAAFEFRALVASCITLSTTRHCLARIRPILNTTTTRHVTTYFQFTTILLHSAHLHYTHLYQSSNLWCCHYAITNPVAHRLQATTIQTAMSFPHTPSLPKTTLCTEEHQTNSYLPLLSSPSNDSDDLCPFPASAKETSYDYMHHQ